MKVVDNTEIIVQATKNDERITKVGFFFRKFSFKQNGEIFKYGSWDIKIFGRK